MRLLFRTRYSGIVGGAEAYASRAATALRELGHVVDVVYDEATPDRTPVDAHARPLSEAPQVPYDAALLHHLGPTTEAQLGRAAAYYVHDYVGTCATGSKTHARLGFATCERRFGTGCLAANYPLGCGARDPRTLVRLLRKRYGERERMGRAGRLLVASRHMHDHLVREGFAPRRLRVVQPALLPPDAELRDAPPPPSPLVILFLGRLTELKGPGTLLEAARLLHGDTGASIALHYAGSGPAEAKLRASAAAAPFPVRFLGWIDAAGRREALRASHVLALPSLWPEPYGLVGLEAAAHGVPTVAFDRGGIRQWLRHRESGLLVPDVGPEGMARALGEALLDETRYAHLRAGALRSAEQRTPRRGGQALANALAELAEETA
ncbi:MAG: glycosyltransferase family 4 protein [Myxococcota bacterium]